MMQIFETGTGKFCPLADEQVGSLNKAQAAAYSEVSDAVRALADAEAELATASTKVEADLAVLAVAQKNAPRFDPDAERVRLVKQMIANSGDGMNTNAHGPLGLNRP